MNWELVVSFVALIASVLALGPSVYFWRRQFRPIVTAAIKTHRGGNASIAYDLVLQNSGTIPARNLRIIKEDESSLAAAFGSDATAANRRRWLACFEDDALISILQNGDSTSCSFGFTGEEDTGFWKYGASIKINIIYEGWFGRQFKQPQTIKITDSDSFTAYRWN